MSDAEYKEFLADYIAIVLSGLSLGAFVMLVVLIIFVIFNYERGEPLGIFCPKPIRMPKPPPPPSKERLEIEYEQYKTKHPSKMSDKELLGFEHNFVTAFADFKHGTNFNARFRAGECIVQIYKEINILEGKNHD